MFDYRALYESQPSVDFPRVVQSSESCRGCSRENLCVCLCKTAVFDNEESRLFFETPKLILTFIQTIDIGLKQNLMKNWIKMHIIIK